MEFDLYAFTKFLHVAAVIVWIGAGVGLVALGIAADRTNDNEALGRIVANVVFLAPRLFMPASLAALVTGAFAAWLTWNLTDLWIWLGLVGFAATFVTGNWILRPRAETVSRLIASEGFTPRVAAVGRELLSISKFDYVMLFVVVADMIYKPAPGDWALLAAFVVVLAVAAYAFLQPVLMGAARPAAG